MLLPLLCFAPMLMGVLCYAVGRFSARWRWILMALTDAGVLAGCLVLFGRDTRFVWDGFCGLGLSLCADGFRSLYALVAAFMWLMTGLFSPEYFAHYHRRGRYIFFNLMTLGATVGVFLSDDLYTTLIFFEVMSLTSYTWVAQEETAGAMRAAGTYLAVAVIGGLTTLMGLFLLWRELGTLSFDGMRAAIGEGRGTPGVLTAASWLTLFGFAAKAGMFPVHIWLPKAHPVAPAPASALLSGVLTKTGVFGVIVITSRLMAGNMAFGNTLLVFAAVTMFLGALLALFSVDLKRTLACSSASQIGFITVGLSFALLLGEEGSLAAYGALEHMVNHSLIKLCLFLCAGTVFMNLHQLNLNEIRGFGRGKPVLHIAFLLGALSIGCIPPLGSGFNSKSLIHEGILEYIAHLQAHGGSWQIYKALEILFLISGGLTIAYMTKLYVCLFWERHPTRQEEFDRKNRSCMRPLSAAVLLLTALPLPFLGLLGAQLLSPLAERSMPFFGQEPLAHAIHYFSGENLLGAAESLAIGAAVYFLAVRPLLMARQEDGTRIYVNRWPAWLDLENLYRLILGLLVRVLHPIVRFIAELPDSKLIRRWIPGLVCGVTRFISNLPESWAVTRFLPTACAAVTRFVSELPERFVVLARRSVLSPLRARAKAPVGSRATWNLGRALDRAAARLNASGRFRHRFRTDYEYVLDEEAHIAQEETSTVLSSVSFGLLLTILGLLGTMLYLLLR